ncbi:MAG TPA: DUF1992 domain-containing protein [Pseudonocardiaceae bacterium]|jgi:hypothetical protein
MTERKPAGVNFETWVDAQVRAAQNSGAFDNLAGAGKPIPNLDQPYDENWWVKQKLREEDVPTEALLPPSLRLRREIERLPETVRELAAERLVREVVADLNERIVAWQRSPTPPHVPVRRVDADKIVEQWCASRPHREAPPATEAPRPTSWWRRIIERSR